MPCKFVSRQGRFLAEPLYAKALSTRRREFGTDHLDTADSLNNLAVLYLDQGRICRGRVALEGSGGDYGASVGRGASEYENCARKL